MSEFTIRPSDGNTVSLNIASETFQQSINAIQHFSTKNVGNKEDCPKLLQLSALAAYGNLSKTEYTMLPSLIREYILTTYLKRYGWSPKTHKMFSQQFKDEVETILILSIKDWKFPNDVIFVLLKKLSQTATYELEPHLEKMPWKKVSQ